VEGEVNEEMAMEMMDVIKGIDLGSVKGKSRGDKIAKYVQISLISEELKQKREEIFELLNEEEKREATSVYYEIRGIDTPEYLSVRDVAEFLNVSPQMVRRYAAEGKIGATQRLDVGRTQWLIPSIQFINDPKWKTFVEDKLQVRQNNMDTAETMLKLLAEEDE